MCQGRPEVKEGFPEEGKENEEVCQARYVQNSLLASNHVRKSLEVELNTER